MTDKNTTDDLSSIIAVGENMESPVNVEYGAEPMIKDRGMIVGKGVIVEILDEHLDEKTREDMKVYIEHSAIGALSSEYEAARMAERLKLIEGMDPGVSVSGRKLYVAVDPRVFGHIVAGVAHVRRISRDRANVRYINARNKRKNLRK